MPNGFILLTFIWIWFLRYLWYDACNFTVY